MLKWLKCFLFGHKWIEKGKTSQHQQYNGKPYKTVNFLLSRCEKCGKYKEYETKAYYDKLDYGE